MQEKNKRLFENIISQGALQVVNYIIPLITLPYQVRVVGAEKFGLIAFAIATITYFTMIVDYGFTWSATKAISENRHNQNNISNIFNSVMCIKIVLMLCCFLFLCCLLLLVPKFQQNWLIFILTFILVIGNAVYPTWFFVGQERVKYITIFSVIAKSIFMIALFVFVKKEADYWLIPLLNGIGALIAGIIGFIYAVRQFKIRLYFPRIFSIIKNFKESTQFFFTNIAVALFLNTNVFCLGLSCTDLIVGYYSAAEKIFNAILGLRFPLDVSLFPYMVRNKDIKFFKKFASIATLLNTVICIAIIYLSGFLINIIFGQTMEPSVKALQIFCIAAIFEFPSVIAGYQLLVVYGHKTEANYSLYVTSIIHLLILGILFVFDQLTIYNVSVLVVFTTILNFIVRMYFVSKFKLLKTRV